MPFINVHVALVFDEGTDLSLLIIFGARNRSVASIFRRPPRWDNKFVVRQITVNISRTSEWEWDRAPKSRCRFGGEDALEMTAFAWMNKDGPRLWCVQTSDIEAVGCHVDLLHCSLLQLHYSVIVVVSKTETLLVLLHSRRHYNCYVRESACRHMC